MIRTDVLVIGGGPAGAACAGRLKQHSIDCIVLDRAEFPRFKPCAGWITPQVLKLAGLDRAAYPFGLTEFTRFDVSINGFRFKLPTHQYAIRRVEFDHWLLQKSGAEFHRHEVREIRLEKDQYIVDGEFSAPVLVGAGGTHCPVRAAFFDQEAPRRRESLIVAQEEEFRYPAGDSLCSLWFFEEHLPGYVWFVPKQDGYVNVGVGGYEEPMKRRGDTLKHHWNLLVRSLEQSGLVREHDYKPVGHSYYIRHDPPQARSGNVFLVGDALGLATLDMGEGIGPAISSGQLAADAIAHAGEYSVGSIPRYSFPSLLGWRRGG